MKDKTIIFGIFYDIFAGLSIPSSPPRPVQRQKTSHLVLAVRPHPLHYIIRTIKCFTAETDRVTSSKQTWKRRYAKLSHCPEKASTRALSLLKAPTSTFTFKTLLRQDIYIQFLTWVDCCSSVIVKTSRRFVSSSSNESNGSGTDYVVTLHPFSFHFSHQIISSYLHSSQTRSIQYLHRYLHSRQTRRPDNIRHTKFPNRRMLQKLFS